MDEQELSAGLALLDFLDRTAEHCLTSSPEVQPLEPETLRPQDVILFRVDEITYEEEAPWKEALENVMSAARIPGVNFVYLLLGSAAGVQFYYGLSRDYSAPARDNRLTIAELGGSVLKDSLAGNFRGSQVTAVEDQDAILERMRRMKKVARIEGVAGSVKDDERFQSVDRLVDVMQGDPEGPLVRQGEFCLLVVAKALDQEQIARLEGDICQTYNTLAPLLRCGVQEGRSLGEGRTITQTREDSDSTAETDAQTHCEQTAESSSSGKSRDVSTAKVHTHNTQKDDRNTDTKATSKNKQDVTQTVSGNRTTQSVEAGQETQDRTVVNTTTTGDQTNTTVDERTTNSAGRTTNTSDSHETGTRTTHTSTQGRSEQTSQSSGVTQSRSREYPDRRVQEWLKYCDEVILPRLDYGRGKGLFTAACYVMTNSASALIKLENTALSLYSGKEGNRVPLRAFHLEEKDPQRRAAWNLQLPQGRFLPGTGQRAARAVLSQPPSAPEGFPLGNWITTNELAMIAGLPRKEVVGMRLREEVEFGLNCPLPREEDRIELGRLVQNGKVISVPVYLDKGVLDKHIFVSGVTGSGKTTTCQNLLLRSGLPFLVIEPAKTEYRSMAGHPECGEMIVFTLGDDREAPFRLNPFELLPRESITSHVDMMKASMEAAFAMEAAIPQLIEETLYRCYENFGWDIATGRNTRYPDPFAPGVYPFPQLSDFLQVIPKVVEEHDFDERLKKDYTGSLTARLKNLTLGAKGAMLDTPRSIDWDSLLDRQVVFELQEVRSGSEKSLIMGFILSAFNEAVRERFERRGQRPHSHILLVEEAHRLLSRYTPGDSANKKHGVEMFSDMLSEIRKYGECLIIADQIPNKMAEDVLKNTNTKIVHRIFAQDDKEAIGSTMSLTGEQKGFLSNLGAGRAILFSDGMGRAVQVQVTPKGEEPRPLSGGWLRERAFRYYLEESHIFMTLKTDPFALPPERCRRALDLIRLDIPTRIIENSLTWNPEWAALLGELLEEGAVSPEDLAQWTIPHGRRLSRWLGTPEEDRLRQVLQEFFTAYPQGDKALGRVPIDRYF